MRTFHTRKRLTYLGAPKAVLTVRKPSLLIGLWLLFPLLGILGCLALLVHVIITRPVPGIGAFLQVAAAIGILPGLLALASIRKGRALLEDESEAEPLRFKETGWVLGVPVGLAVGLAYIILRSVPAEVNFLTIYLRPLVIILAFCCVLWAVLTRLVARRLGLGLDDYAAAAVIPPEEYATLKRHKEAWLLAKYPTVITVEMASRYLPDIIPALARKLERNPDLKEEEHVLQLLGGLGSDSVAGQMIAALSSPRPQNRRAAAVALGKLNIPEAAPKLISLALEDPKATVRRSAVVVLRKLRAEVAAPALMQALRDSDAAVRQSACVALGELQVEEARPLLETSQRDPDPKVRQSAGKALELLQKESPEGM